VPRRCHPAVRWLRAEIDAAIRRVRDEHGSLTVTMTGQRMRLIDRIEALAADMDLYRAGPAAGPEGPG
jgi:hypothetical protein